MAMIISTDLTIATLYKLRMPGLNIYVPSQILGGGDMIVTNLYITFISLNNNHNSISYNWLRAYVTLVVINMSCISTNLTQLVFWPSHLFLSRTFLS